MAEIIWERRDCVSAEVEDALVLLDLDTLVYHSLNSTATAVWELLETPRSESEIVAALGSRYDVAPDRCRASVRSLLARLEEAKLAAPCASSAA